MKIKILLGELDNLNLPKNEYVITSSGLLAIRGIREANDLDLVVSNNLWKALSKKFPVKKEGFEYIIVGNIQVLHKGSFYQDSQIASVEEQIKTADIIDGYPFANLELIKKFKKLGGRDKDLNDLKLIKEYETNKLS